ncbi:MAG: hypothetical protein ACKO3T_25845, partial [Planctomycetaceae bacterium]
MADQAQNKDVVMLRALGIAFIACSLMLFGITLGGTAWWLISSRVVTIRGLNDQAVAGSDPAAPSDVAADSDHRGDDA